MNGDEAKKLINKHTGISVGLAIVILGAAMFMVRQNTAVQAKVSEIDERTANLEVDFIPREVIELRLSNIEEGVNELRAYIIKK